MIDKTVVIRILELEKKFDKDNYTIRVSGHFDSNAEYENMKINYILNNI